MLGFVNTVTIHDCWSNFYQPGSRTFWRLSKKWERKYSHLIACFYELLPRITTDKKWHVSKMHFLHVKVVKSDAMKTRRSCKSGDKTPVMPAIVSTSFQRHIVLLEIVALTNYKKKTETLKLMMLTSSVWPGVLIFVSKWRTYVFVLTIDCMLLSMFCSWFITLWKSSFPRTPSTPRK